MKSKIHYKGFVNEQDLDDLKELLFFNEEQTKYKDSIVASIELFGLPEIVQTNEKYSIKVKKQPDSQTIFAFDDSDNLLGVALFCRDSKENISLIHLAVKNRLSQKYVKEYENVALSLVENLINIAKKIKGIETITILYSHNENSKIKIKR